LLLRVADALVQTAKEFELPPKSRTSPPKRKPAGRVNPFAVWDGKHMNLAAAVWMKAATGEYEPDAAWNPVAEEKHVPYSTVRRAWKKYETAFDLSDTNAGPKWFQKVRTL